MEAPQSPPGHTEPPGPHRAPGRDPKRRPQARWQPSGLALWDPKGREEQAPWGGGRASGLVAGMGPTGGNGGTAAGRAHLLPGPGLLPVLDPVPVPVLDPLPAPLPVPLLVPVPVPSRSPQPSRKRGGSASPAPPGISQFDRQAPQPIGAGCCL